jgi:hypothetical protein
MRAVDFVAILSRSPLVHGRQGYEDVCNGRQEVQMSGRRLVGHRSPMSPIRVRIWRYCRCLISDIRVSPQKLERTIRGPHMADENKRCEVDERNLAWSVSCPAQKYASSLCLPLEMTGELNVTSTREWLMHLVRFSSRGADTATIASIV